MKTKVSFLITAALCLYLVGCYDDSKLQEDVADLQKRVSALELLCSQMNNNIVGMQTIINALNNNDYITSVTPIKNGEEEVGYTISFLKSSPITIYHGAKGTDGKTPVIGLSQDFDMMWYWTVDGNWLLDKDGQKVCANGIKGDKGDNGAPGVSPQLKIEDDYWYISTDNGLSWSKLDKATGQDGRPGSTPIIGIRQDTDGSWYWTIGNDWLLDDQNQKVRANGIQGDKGEQGAPGITPQLKIQDGYWYVSIDNGASWVKQGKATGDNGKDGDSMFKSVTYDDKYVYFTLVNGTILTVPLSTNIPKLQFSLSKESDIHLSAGQSIVLDYTISARAGAKTSLRSYEWENWKVVITPNSNINGTITITAPNPIENGKILLILTDDYGNVFVKTLLITGDPNSIKIIQTEWTIDEFGGYLDVPVEANLDFTIQIEENAKDWLQVITSGANTRLAVAANSSYSSRSAVVTFKGNDGKTKKEITINQLQNNAIVITSNVIDISDKEQTFNIIVRSNIECKVYIPAGGDWLTDMTTKSLDEKIFVLRAETNEGYDARTVDVVVSDLDEQLKQMVTVCQSGYTPVYINIPDPEFLKCLIESYDINADGKIDEKEAPLITSIDCSSRNITSLKGIEKFPNLTSLDCSKTQITALDISANTALTSILCQYCEQMTDLLLPPIKIINASAFFNCSALKELDLPRTISSVGKDAFLNCSSLKELTIRSDTNIKYASVFGGTIIKDLLVTDECTNLVDSFFEGCKTLEHARIEGRVTSLGKAAFSDCNTLCSVSLGESVENIGSICFERCTLLKSVTVDRYSRLRVLYYGCFNRCKSLELLDFSNSLDVKGIAQYYQVMSQGVWQTNYSCIFSNCNEQSIIIKLGTRVPPVINGYANASVTTYGIYSTHHSSDSTDSSYNSGYCNLNIYVPSDCIDVYKKDKKWYDSQYVTINAL